MGRLLLAATLFCCDLTHAAASAPGVQIRHGGPASDPLEGLADLVIDLGDHMKIIDVEEEEEEGTEAGDKATLCIAPPCGLKADAIPLTQLPVPWSMRLKAPATTEA